MLVLSAAVLVIGLSHWTITSYYHDDEYEVQVPPLTVEFNSNIGLFVLVLVLSVAVLVIGFV